MLDGFGLHEIVWNMADQVIGDDLVASAADARGRGILLHVRQDGAAADLSGAAVYLVWRHRVTGKRGTEAFAAAEGAAGSFAVYYPAAMCEARGIVDAQVMVSLGDDAYISTRTFCVRVERVLVDGLEPRDGFTLFVEAIAAYENAADVSTEAAEAAAAAAADAGAAADAARDAADAASKAESDLRAAAANGEFNGADGADGKDGCDGAAGAAGRDGADGRDGVDGVSPVATVTQTATGALISITDANGTTTAELANGAKGDTGETGPAGPRGEKGDTGPAGPQGIQGETGPAGPQGRRGEKGETGATGPEGPAGPAGEKGDTGPAGPQGPAGETGATGPAGPAGADGTSFTPVAPLSLSDGELCVDLSGYAERSGQRNIYDLTARGNLPEQGYTSTAYFDADSEAAGAQVGDVFVDYKRDRLALLTSKKASGANYTLNLKTVWDFADLRGVILTTTLDAEAGQTDGGWAGRTAHAIAADTLVLNTETGNLMKVTSTVVPVNDITSPYVTVLGLGNVYNANAGTSLAALSPLSIADGVISIDFSGYAALSGAAFTGAVSGLTPTASAHFATKGYVDGLLANLMQEVF